MISTQPFRIQAQGQFYNTMEAKDSHLIQSNVMVRVYHDQGQPLKISHLIISALNKFINLNFQDAVIGIIWDILRKPKHSSLNLTSLNDNQS